MSKTETSENQDSKTSHAHVLRVWCKRILKLILACFIFFLAALSAVYWFLQRDPQALARSYLEEIEKTTGLKCSFGTAIVTLLPLPSIEIYDITLKAEKAELGIALILARPALGDLIQGKFIPASLSIFRPIFTAHTEINFDHAASIPDQLKELAENLLPKSETKGESELNLPDLMSLTIRNGRIRILGIDHNGIFSRNIHANFDFFPALGLRGKLTAARIRGYQQRKPVFSIDKPEFESVFNKNLLERLHFSTTLNIRNWVQDGRFSLLFSRADFNSWIIEPDFRGFFTPGSAKLPLEFSGRFTRLTGTNIIVCSGLNFLADADNGNANLLLKTGANLSDYTLEGSLQLSRFSLPQWLGFARNLPPGLQMALDNIIRAKLEFQLNSKGLNVSNIVATSTGATFSGTGGVPNFSKPVVTLNLRSPLVNLGLALPESLAKAPDPLFFPFEPLTPMPGEPLKEGEDGIGYDIRLAADKLLYGSFTLGDASLHIHQGKLDKQLMLEDVLLDGKAKLAGGNLSASCILGADPALPCNIKASATALNAKALNSQWSKLQLVKGTLGGQADIWSEGKDLKTFLKNLHGPISVNGANIVAKMTGNTNFVNLELATKLRTAQLEKNGASFDGQWRVAASAVPFNLNGDFSGKVKLDEKGINFRSLSSNLKINLLNFTDFLPKTLPVAVKGLLSGDSSDGIFEIQNLNLDCLNANIGGKIKINSEKLSCSGKITADVPKLAETIKKLGVQKLALPPSLTALKLASNLSANTDRIQLENIQASISKENINGNLDIILKTIPELNFNLDVNSLNLDDYKQPDKTSKNEKWDFSFLKNFDAKGNLKFNVLHGFDLTFHKVNLPLKLAQGKLMVGPATASFYGSRLESRANADFSRGISFSSIVSVKDFNLGEAVKERKMDAILSGNASLETNIRADLSGPDQLFKNMDGNWSVKVTNGSWQTRNKNGKLEGKPTKFNLVSASGTIAKGYARSNDLTLKSADLQLAGKGEINLVNNTIDCNMNVNMKNLPDFPVHIYGSMDNPKTSIGTGQLVLNAIGGIFTGIGNVLGGIVNGIGSIFR